MKLFKKDNKLYPSIEPFDSGFIKKGIHEIYYEQCGNPKGKPAIFLHGGPGGGAGKLSRRFFNPKKVGRNFGRHFWTNILDAKL